MTLVAAFAVQDTPVLFGDLLLSGPTKLGSSDVNIPALGNVEDFFGGSEGGWHVLGLTQKVVLVSSNCVIGWAGDWIGARIAIDYLRKLSARGPLTHKSVLAHLAEVESEFPETSIVGWTSEGAESFKFGLNAKTLNTSTLREIIAAGTGIHAIDHYANTSPDIRNLEGQLRGPQKALFHGCNMAARLLGEELHGGDAASTIRHSFGGGYEIAMPANNVFTKIGGMTFVIWSAGIGHGGFGLSPRMIMKQQYQEDFLLLRSARLQSAPQRGEVEIFDQQFHVVRPMYETPAPTLPAKEDVLFDSRVFIHFFLVRRENGVQFLSLFQAFETKEYADFKLEERDGYLLLAHKNSFIGNIQRALQALK